MQAKFNVLAHSKWIEFFMNFNSKIINVKNNKVSIPEIHKVIMKMYEHKYIKSKEQFSRIKNRKENICLANNLFSISFIFDLFWKFASNVFFQYCLCFCAFLILYAWKQLVFKVKKQIFATKTSQRIGQKINKFHVDFFCGWNKTN